MPRHEDKICPSCNTIFECKLGSINLCDCTTVKLDDGERAFISDLYNDCICINCLLELKKTYKQKHSKEKTHNLLKSPLE